MSPPPSMPLPTPHDDIRDAESVIESLRSPSSSSSTSPPAGEMDENSLLAETEELLSTLDAAAFAPSPIVGPHNAIGQYRWGEGQHAIPIRAEAAAARNATIPGIKKRVQTQERVKHELVELRRIAAELQNQLVSLHQSNSSAIRKKQVILETWQRIAERQVCARERAEAENEQLKAILCGIFRAADQFSLYAAATRLLTTLPNYSHGPPKVRICFEGMDLQLPKTCELLLDRLDVAYADMEAVFRENGLDQHLTEPRSYKKNKTQQLSSDPESRYIELGSVGVIPFAPRVVGNLMWQTMTQWHHKDNAYSHVCTDRPDDTFVVNYRVKSKASNENQSVVLTLAMRRYFARDRIVFVWTAQSDGEKDLVDMYTKETGWMAISSIVLPDTSESPIAIIQSCMQIVPRSKSERMHPKKASRLANLVLSGVEEDATFMSQILENLLLQEARSGSARLGKRTAGLKVSVRFIDRTARVMLRTKQQHVELKEEWRASVKWDLLRRELAPVVTPDVVEQCGTEWDVGFDHPKSECEDDKLDCTIAK